MVDGRLRGRELGTVGEAVGCQVDDAHDTGPTERRPRQTRARLPQRLEEAGRRERLDPPFAFAELRDDKHRAAIAGPMPPDDLERGEVETATRERQAAGARLGGCGQSRQKADWL